MVTVLLIWEEVPEKIRFFGIEQPKDEDLAVLSAAHGYYLNTDIGKEAKAALNKISAALSEINQGYEEVDPAYSWIGRWFECEIVAEKLPNCAPFAKVFSCGCVL